MKSTIANGVWPTMVTPYTEDNKVDYEGVLKIIDWYDKQGVAGIFAVCQSSEMFFLSKEERLELAKFIVENTPKHMGVIASGHVADTACEQIEEAKEVIDLGIDAYVFISNKFAAPDEGEEVVKKNIDKIVNSIHNINFGIYECPYPYKRLITPETLKWCADTDRFLFLKDTCCNLEGLQAKVNATAGTNLKIYNANAATLLESLKMGCAGYSGIMTNFHAELYVWLCENYAKYPGKAEKLQAFLGAASVIECQCYPVNAKYHMQLEGLGINYHSRVKDKNELTQSRQIEVKQMQVMYHLVKEWLDI
ncbi:dihydrodipicolinate synthase family protein [Cellulosilyticum sp. I15G10I2]|uniref:dihydrodipicolinate synthase family protein n=1 Tax=Cellulosilyticum sp. I15G10I2 TaxID=1892843 RepID=UPI00085C16D4|nr:dihydrodipicolinate synthase family protein [Cellulosilyticum sp. I15G10I2]